MYYGGVDLPWKIIEKNSSVSKQSLPSLPTLKTSMFSAETKTSMPVLTLQQPQIESNTMNRP